jgi:L-Ala-D/L-Glu epimerase
MVGCMLETSVLIAAGLVVAQGTDYADLDGSWLLADDPFEGLEIKDGRVSVADRPGLGIAVEL